MRIEVWKRQADNWKLRAATALAVASIFVVAIWWLIQDKVGHVLK